MERLRGIARFVPLLLLPLFLLGLVFSLSGNFGLTGNVVTEELMIERLTFDYHKIEADVRNVGPIDLAISTVFINQAIWSFDAQPRTQLGRLETAKVTIPYDWIYGETVTISFLTSPSNLEFAKTVEAAVATPQPNAANFVNLGKVGLIVGVIPVFLGLMLLPLFRRVGSRVINLLLGFTVGLLVFLALDAVGEALEISSELPRSFSGLGLIATGVAGMFLALTALNMRSSGKRGEGTALLTVAYLVSLGIGLHNMGEGLAIGSAFALGAVAFGTRLIIGFTIHNTTEGLAIASPIIRQPVASMNLVWMGLIAGVPTIFGGWVGGFIRSEILAVLFLAVGAGAILEVVYEILIHVKGIFTANGYTGILAGFIIMYTTALLVTG